MRARCRGRMGGSGIELRGDNMDGMRDGIGCNSGGCGFVIPVEGRG